MPDATLLDARRSFLRSSNQPRSDKLLILLYLLSVGSVRAAKTVADTSPLTSYLKDLLQGYEECHASGALVDLRFASDCMSGLLGCK